MKHDRIGAVCEAVLVVGLSRLQRGTADGSRWRVGDAWMAGDVA